MLKKLSTKGINQAREYEERTANLPCTVECNMECYEKHESYVLYQVYAYVTSNW